MKKYIHTPIFRALIAFTVLFLAGCALKLRQPESVLDTPEHHSFNGFKLIKKEWLDDAQREFELALQLHPEYSPAHRGMGLVYGMKKHFNLAFESMRLARNYSKEKEEEALAYVGFMRLHTMKRDAGWMEEVEKNFSRATSAVKDLPAAYYHMGEAYKYGYRFADSEKVFEKVLEINRSLLMEAYQQLEIVQKIERAMPGSDLGKKVAVMDRITRADVAALFIQELRLNQIYEKRKLSKDVVTLRTPATPPDVENHSLRTEIEAILQLDIEGLRLFSDGTFGPDVPITRANYAMMIADIIAKVENDPSLATRYIRSRSPFKDVGKGVFYFNALMVCITRGGIMEAKDGIFYPMGNVSGADALLVIRKLKKELGIL